MSKQTPENMKVESIDDTPFPFGKYKGLTPNQVAEEDPSYIVWAYENIKNYTTCTALLYKACLQDRDEGDYADDEELAESVDSFMERNS